MAAEGSDDKVVTLASKEDVTFEVSYKVASMSVFVTTTLPEDCLDEDEAVTVPVPNVSTLVLEKVIEYCKHYQEVEEMTPIQTPLKSSKLEELVQPFYADFVKVDKDMLFDLVAAANFMDIKSLLDLTCLAVSILIKGKSAAELREMFHISAEWGPEDEARVAEENRQWSREQVALLEQQQREREAQEAANPAPAAAADGGGGAAAADAGDADP